MRQIIPLVNKHLVGPHCVAHTGLNTVDAKIKKRSARLSKRPEALEGCSPEKQNIVWMSKVCDDQVARNPEEGVFEFI